MGWRHRDRPLRTATALNWLWLFLMDSNGKPDHDFVLTCSMGMLKANVHVKAG